MMILAAGACPGSTERQPDAGTIRSNQESRRARGPPVLLRYLLRFDTKRIAYRPLTRYRVRSTGFFSYFVSAFTRLSCSTCCVSYSVRVMVFLPTSLTIIA